MSDTKSNSPAHILVIWDNVDFQNLFLYVFKAPDYIVQTATSCDEGLKIITNEYPDLLIILRSVKDENDGFEFCKKIRANSNIPRFPIIIAGADELDLNPQQCIQKTFEIGANACFGRVFDISDIIPLVNTLLENPALTKLADRQTMNFAKQQ